MPQLRQQGSVMNCIAAKHGPQNRPAALVGASQVRHCGGSSASNAAIPHRPARRQAAFAMPDPPMAQTLRNAGSWHQANTASHPRS